MERRARKRSCAAAIDDDGIGVAERWYRDGRVGGWLVRASAITTLGENALTALSGTFPHRLWLSSRARVPARCWVLVDENYLRLEKSANR